MNAPLYQIFIVGVIAVTMCYALLKFTQYADKQRKK